MAKKVKFMFCEKLSSNTSKNDAHIDCTHFVLVSFLFSTFFFSFCWQKCIHKSEYIHSYKTFTISSLVCRLFFHLFLSLARSPPFAAHTSSISFRIRWNIIFPRNDIIFACKHTYFPLASHRHSCASNLWCMDYDFFFLHFFIHVLLLSSIPFSDAYGSCIRFQWTHISEIWNKFFSLFEFLCVL